MKTQKSKQMFDELKRFLAEGGVVYGCLPNPAALVKELQRRKPLRILFGETVDEFGMPIDSLKYYFLLSLLQRNFELSGIKTEATVVIADVASLLNDSAIDRQDAIRQAIAKRRKFLEHIIAGYDLPIRVRFMSEIFASAAYQQIITDVHIALKDEILFRQVEPFLVQTVLKNRLTEEREKKFRYAVEAIATGLLFDLKIGPPREVHYDRAANIIGKTLGRSPLFSLYLTPTYPLGQNFAFFLTHPKIEEFGVTPYKAGSNKLQEYRIILGETSFARAEALVRSSFESLKPETAHPVFDLFIIADMARKLFENDYTLSRYDLTQFQGIDQLKAETTGQLKEYIYRPLELEGL